jgi:hypothetical protein
MPGYKGRLRVTTDDVGVRFIYVREPREPRRATNWGIAWRFGAVVGFAALAFGTVAASDEGGPVARGAETALEFVQVPEDNDLRTGLALGSMAATLVAAASAHRTALRYAEQRQDEIFAERAPTFTLDETGQVFTGELLPPRPDYKPDAS